MEKCEFCGKPMKTGKNHSNCYQCECVKTLVRKGNNAPSSKTMQAIRQIGRHGINLIENIQLRRAQNAH